METMLIEWRPVTNHRKKWVHGTGPRHPRGKDQRKRRGPPDLGRTRRENSQLQAVQLPKEGLSWVPNGGLRPLPG